MQHYFIYPEAKAIETKPLYIKRGWTEEDFNTLLDLGQDLNTRINNIGATLISCDFRNRSSIRTIWNIKISTPGHCDIFQLLNALRQTFDMNGIDETFTYIHTSSNNKEVYIEFTHEG